MVFRASVDIVSINWLSTVIDTVVGKSFNRSSPTDHYEQLRILIPEFSADTGSHQMNVVNTQPTH